MAGTRKKPTSQSTLPDPMSMTQPEFARFVLSESENAAHIIEAAGIKPP
jgi:hypothetical protein